MSDRPTPSDSAVTQTAAALRALFDEGEPAVVRGAGALFSEAEVIEWIKQAHPAARAHTARDKIDALKQSWGLSPTERDTSDQPDPGRSVEVYRDGALVLDPAPFVPQPHHTSLAQWVADTGPRLGGTFGMQAPGIECASWDALERLHALLAPTLALTGPRTYRYNAFLGDYRRTPFGFHVDPHQEAVFQVVITGRRRGLFWEGLTLTDDDAAWVEDSNGLTVPAREPEVVLDLEPGDIVFWPGTHVHGFETTGPSLALSMVIDRASPRTRAQVVADLECATIMGKPALPPVFDAPPVVESDVVEPRPGFCLRYERCDDALFVGVCGRTFEWPDRNSIGAAIKLLDRLRQGGALRVSELADACADEWLERAEVCDVLTMLRGLGWLR